MQHASRYLTETFALVAAIKPDELGRLAAAIGAVQAAGGRLFIAGLGGSAANASHAANDFRKLAGIQAIALNDNAAELTARANDEGWGTIYAEALRVSRPTACDALLVLSVGGGTAEVSLPLVNAIDVARQYGMKVLGIVGRDGGHTLKHGDAVVLIPPLFPERVTPHTESFQMVVLHYLVSHPALQQRQTKW